MTQEALKLALECAERCEEIDGMYSWSATITAIKEALAQTEQEPVLLSLAYVKKLEEALATKIRHRYEDSPVALSLPTTKTSHD